MKTISLHFRDVLELLEFIERTQLQEYAVDIDRQTLVGTMSDAQLELALNGYSATLIEDNTSS